MYYEDLVMWQCIVYIMMKTTLRKSLRFNTQSELSRILCVYVSKHFPSFNTHHLKCDSQCTFLLTMVGSQDTQTHIKVPRLRV